jgi:hypothetical protein
MTDNNQETQTEKQQSAVKRRPPLFAMVFLYILGFFITQKTEYDSSTGLGITMLIFGWLCILLSVFLSVTVFIRIFKEQFKKK